MSRTISATGNTIAPDRFPHTLPARITTPDPAPPPRAYPRFSHTLILQDAFQSIEILLPDPRSSSPSFLLPSNFIYLLEIVSLVFEPTFVNTLHHLTRRAPLDLSFYFIPRVSFPVSNQSIQNRSQCRVTKQQQHARNFPFDTR